MLPTASPKSHTSPPTGALVFLLRYVLQSTQTMNCVTWMSRYSSRVVSCRLGQLGRYDTKTSVDTLHSIHRSSIFFFFFFSSAKWCQVISGGVVVCSFVVGVYAPWTAFAPRRLCRFYFCCACVDIPSRSGLADNASCVRVCVPHSPRDKNSSRGKHVPDSTLSSPV